MTTRPTVTTTSGDVRGRAQPTGGALFAGIPFAQAPVGELRLRPPQPNASWEGVREASEFPPCPPQRGTVSLPDNESLSALGRTSEDCLYLNIWTPGIEGARPVIVWIYGGGFELGSASPPMTDAASLGRRTGAVVVALNYRLGALGWLHLAGVGGQEWADSSNLGLQDQIAGLHWVQENIEAFGGDPGNVTLVGESAGAFSIGALLAAPSAAGTFHHAILSSGSTERVYSAKIAASIADDLFAALRVSTVDEFRSMSAERILEAQATVIDSDIGRRNLSGGRAWGVVHDGTVLPILPQQAVRAGSAKNVSLLVSANRDEIRMWEQLPGFVPSHDDELLAEMRRTGFSEPDALLSAYRKRDPDAGLARLRTRFLTDAIYRIPASRLAQAQVDAGGKAYAALFSGQPAGPEAGTPHGADVPYFFDQLNVAGADTPENVAIADDLLDAWRRFVSTGDPGWPVYDGGAGSNTREFGGSGSLVTEPADDEVAALWRAQER
ncbi:MAG: Carboxylesterase type [Amycolatopsis sp.]|uniref:carboxylesterase/lipase family protein n=1 Tax=Amycolatopsis sp. TaxID=37632 RepID=UPI0026229A74|nr:carboxylesterase family protein [Amycolatopsis sp.]MCU1685861.1 Carboxylesterase type [Amycolatopsis sp.]